MDVSLQSPAFVRVTDLTTGVPVPHQDKDVVSSSSCQQDKFGSGCGSNDSSDSSSSIGEEEAEEEENENEAELQKHKFSLDSLEDSLPIKRGLSNHYSGKSKSFANLGDVVSSVKDLGKPENPFNKRRRVLMANKWSSRRSSFYSWQNPKSMPLLPALDEQDDDDDDDDDDDQNMRVWDHKHQQTDEDLLMNEWKWV